MQHRTLRNLAVRCLSLHARVSPHVSLMSRMSFPLRYNSTVTAEHLSPAEQISVKGRQMLALAEKLHLEEDEDEPCEKGDLLIEKGVSLLVEAAKAKSGSACYELAKLSHRSGEDEEAIEYLLQAVELHYPEALSRYASCLADGEFGFEVDMEASHELFKMAAELGDVTGMYNYAVILVEEGKDQEANILFKRCAEKNDPAGQYQYAMTIDITENAGEMREKNIEEYEKHMRGAADSMILEATVSLVDMYAHRLQAAMDKNDGYNVTKYDFLYRHYLKQAKNLKDT